MKKGCLVFGRQRPELKYRLRRGCYAIVLDDENRLLTIKKPMGVFLPGGAIEENESHTECLHREFLEETGHNVTLGVHFGHAKRFFVRRSMNEPILSDAHFYEANLGPKVQVATEKTHEMQWIETEYIRNVLFHEHHIWAVMEFLKRYYPK